MASVIISSGLRDFLPSVTATKESIRFDEVLTNSCRSPPNSSRIDIIVQIYYKRICGVDIQIKHEQKKIVTRSSKTISRDTAIEKQHELP
jgi:hypothetical protein